MPDSDAGENHAERTLAFLAEIGLPVRRAPIEEDTFLPGILLKAGGLVVDTCKLLYPGDLLHEAGHLAILSPPDRASADGNLDAEMGEEIATQAWSFAAAQACGMPLEILFHDNGYKGSAAWLRDLYRGGTYPGAVLLAWYGMTFDDPAKAPEGTPLYPAMQTWLRVTAHPPFDDQGNLMFAK